MLANELLATRLAERLGLPVPVAEIVKVDSWLIENTPELHIDLGGASEPCAPGLQFGARYVCDPAEGHIFDYLPENLLAKVKNSGAFAGMLVLDKWLGNANGRQAVFWKKAHERKYNVTFIDQGYCFNAGDWDFSDSALRGVYPHNRVYERVAGWESFAPWLERAENFAPEIVRQIAADLPPQWIANDWPALENLVETIVARRSGIKQLIEAFRESSRQPFPNWVQAKATAQGS